MRVWGLVAVSVASVCLVVAFLCFVAHSPILLQTEKEAKLEEKLEKLEEKQVALEAKLETALAVDPSTRDHELVSTLREQLTNLTTEKVAIHQRLIALSGVSLSLWLSRCPFLLWGSLCPFPWLALFV